ncbi:MAG: hypothetical protein JST93_22190 [Acidobacteria bacterium]|nr:hypothetical protein [Acidobacteriota bacterium]
MPLPVYFFLIAWFAICLAMVIAPQHCVFMMRMRLSNADPSEHELSEVRVQGALMLIFGGISMIVAHLDP